MGMLEDSGRLPVGVRDAMRAVEKAAEDLGAAMSQENLGEVSEAPIYVALDEIAEELLGQLPDRRGS